MLVNPDLKQIFKTFVARSCGNFYIYSSNIARQIDIMRKGENKLKRKSITTQPFKLASNIIFKNANGSFDWLQ